MAGNSSSIEVLPNLLSDHVFTDQMRQVAQHTADTRREAAFVVYGDDTAYQVSDVVTGTKSFDFIDDADYDSVDMAALIYRGHQQLRDDIILGLHSHPLDSHPRPPREALVDDATYLDFHNLRGQFTHHHRVNLFPSYDDTVLYSRINELNPGHVGAILTTDAAVSLAGLVFYRHTTPKSPEVSPFDDDFTPSKETMIPRMTAVGFAVIEADYKYAENVYTPTIDEIVKTLVN